MIIYGWHHYRLISYTHIYYVFIRRQDLKLDFIILSRKDTFVYHGNTIREENIRFNTGT